MGETREERLARIAETYRDWRDGDTVDELSMLALLAGAVAAEDVAWLIAEVERQHRQLVVLKLSGYARSVIDSNLNDAEYAARIVDGSA